MRFSQVEKGRRAREAVEFDTLDGQRCAAAFRPIDGDLEAEVLKRAQEFSLANGLKDPKPGHPIYELGYEVATLVLAMVDAVDAQQPLVLFWDGGEEQLRRALDRDRIALLFERHARFQDTVSPRKHTLSGEAYILKVFEIATAEGDDDGPFVNLRPGLLKSCMRTMASQLVSSWTARSQDGSSSETAEKP